MEDIESKIRHVTWLMYNAGDEDYYMASLMYWLEMEEKVNSLDPLLWWEYIDNTSFKKLHEENLTFTWRPA